ncbi:alpha/beta hydrolase [Halobacillus litoralis]|uniref:alpha/beta hydrolase n=1 Tax=Halobacillus litoralis TaxID=45668 RepID=UPI001CFF368D|nr:alpha/beta hydrolase [Halobacillus litoralis]
MNHIYKEGTNEKVLLLLHGTGGTEQDLLPIARMIDPKASVLSVRGNVSENGMARYFKRIREGVFDEEDLIERTEELNQFIMEASQKYTFDRDQVIAVGYSNGANIAGSLLFHYKDSLKGAVLFHPMVPRRGKELPEQSGLPVFIGAGENDPICPAQETFDLKALLSDAGADVTDHWEKMGHQLTENEVITAANWYKDNF